MSKIWFCRTCGYEIGSKGRCHSCRQKLIESTLAPLAPGDENDEVGYRVEDWEDRARGRLIAALIDEGILHRFEDDELVVRAEDEEQVDQILVEVATDGDVDHDTDDQLDDEDDGYLDEVAASVGSLYRAAGRLRLDPTDMEADGEVAEASAGVFLADEFGSADVDTWAAVGRVTRRLLAALGSDEALDEEIRRQAGVLVTMLRPIVASLEDGTSAAGDEATLETNGTLLTPADQPVPAAQGSPGAPDRLVERDRSAPQDGLAPQDDLAPQDGLAPQDDEATRDGQGGDDADMGAHADAKAVSGEVVKGEGVEGEVVKAEAVKAEAVEADQAEGDGEDAAEGGAGAGHTGVHADSHDVVAADRVLGAGPETLYEAPEWLPEQRAMLTVLLEERSITHMWDGTDLVVPSAEETAVEEMFDQIGGVNPDDDDESRYRDLEELFAAVDRLANDPADESKGASVVGAAGAVEGPTPLGFDDGQWLALRKRVRTLADAVEHDANPDVVASQAVTLRDTLRALV